MRAFGNTSVDSVIAIAVKYGRVGGISKRQMVCCILYLTRYEATGTAHHSELHKLAQW